MFFLAVLHYLSLCSWVSAGWAWRGSAQDKERALCGFGDVVPASLGRERQNNHLSFGGTGNPLLAFPQSCREGRRRRPQLFYNFDLFVSQTSNTIRLERERRRLQSQEEQQRGCQRNPQHWNFSFQSRRMWWFNPEPWGGVRHSLSPLSLGFASLNQPFPGISSCPQGLSVLTFQGIGVGCSGLDWIGLGELKILNWTVNKRRRGHCHPALLYFWLFIEAVPLESISAEFRIHSHGPWKQNLAVPWEPQDWNAGGFCATAGLDAVHGIQPRPASPVSPPALMVCPVPLLKVVKFHTLQILFSIMFVPPS